MPLLCAYYIEIIMLDAGKADVVCSIVAVPVVLVCVQRSVLQRLGSRRRVSRSSSRREATLSLLRVVSMPLSVYAFIPNVNDYSH